MGAHLSPLEVLEATEKIRIVKARYFRFLDTKDWPGLRALYADDAEFDARGTLHRGADTVVAFIRSRLGPDVTSVHQGYMPEITVTAAGASAIWAMEDTITRLDGTGFHGCGHYHDTYRLVDGAWLISRSRLTRLTFNAVGTGMATDEMQPPELQRF